MKSKYTKELLEPIVYESSSISEVARNLGLNPNCGNHNHISKMIKYHNLDTSHFCGSAWSKGKKLQSKRPIEKYLSNEFPITSNNLKNRLFKEEFFEYKCCKCNLSEWMNEPISLELHHIDRNSQNNSLDNLTILCANCHSLEHRNKTIKETSRLYARKVERPTIEQILKDVEELGYSGTGRKYGVSDNAIRKWLI
jgi:transposase-like protein